MRISDLVKKKTDATHISMLDLLDLTDDAATIREWFCSDFWSDCELARITNEVAYGFLGVDGVLEESDFDDFRFLLQILPDPIFDCSPLELILSDFIADEDDDGDGEGDDDDDDDGDATMAAVTLDSDSYLRFLQYLYREEISLLPGDPDRVFEYALTYGPEQAFEDFVSETGYGIHEIILNLARSEYYSELGDLFYEALVDIRDGDLIVSVFQIIGDQSEQKDAEICELNHMLEDAYDAIDDLCVLAGIDPDALDDDDDEPTTVDDLPGPDVPAAPAPDGEEPAEVPAPVDGAPDAAEPNGPDDTHEPIPDDPPPDPPWNVFTD